MRKKDLAFLLALSAVTAVLSLFVIFVSGKSEKVLTGGIPACEDLSVSLENQQAFFGSLLNEKYAALESLAYVLEIREDLDLSAEREYCDSVMLANAFNALYLTDLEGNVAANDGGRLSGYTDPGLFTELASCKRGRSAQVSDRFRRDGTPAILLSVPVRQKNTLTGVLFAEVAAEDLDAMLLADSFHGSEAVFVTDRSGTVLFRNRNALTMTGEANLPDAWNSASGRNNPADRVRTDMGSGRSGSFTLSNGTGEYWSYAPLGVNDWYLFGMVPDSALLPRHAAQNAAAMKAIRMLSGVFFALAVCTSAVVLLYIQRSSGADRQQELEQQLKAREEEYRIAVSMSHYAVMRYEVKSRTLSILARGADARLLDDALSDVPEQAIRTGLVAPESAGAARSFFADIDSGLSPTGRTELALKTDGEGRTWVELSYSVIGRRDDGRPEAAVISIVDITEKHRAEELINVGGAFMNGTTDAKLFIANLGTGMMEYEAKGTSHRSLLQMAGTNSIRKIMQYALQYAVAPESADALAWFLSPDRLKQEFESGNTEEGLDCLFIGKDGNKKWANLRLKLAKDSLSGFIKVYLVLKDIHMQKNAEENLFLEKSVQKNTETDDAPDASPPKSPTGGKRQIFARTFGYFDFFINGRPLHFTNQKEKELLAILIDRNGGTVTAEEAISLLWEDEPFGEKQLSRYRKLASRLKYTLAEAGCEDIIVTIHGVRHIDVSKIECDYFEALNENSAFIKLYQGTYMLNYSWAEETTAVLNGLLKFAGVC